MGRAHINLEDKADGSFEVRAVFAGGWDKNSHAHQYANLMVNELNSKATPISEPIIKTVEEMEKEMKPGEGWVSATPTLSQ